MAISSFSTDYTGRTKDILVMNGVDPKKQNSQVVDLRLSGDIKFCTGAQKLIQKYTILFLTDINSQIFYPQEGSLFLKNTLQSNNLTQAQLLNIFSPSNLKIVEDIKANAIGKDLPLDEQISYAYINDISASEDTLIFSINIVTLAGSNIKFILPLPLEN